MTSCSEFRELLLTAEPGELRGEGESALAGHLRSCGACRRRAELLLGADDALEAALGASAAPDVDAILALAARAPEKRPLAARAPEKGPLVAGGSEARATARSLLSSRRTWIPLAAAAAVAGVLLVSRGPTPTPLPAVARAEAPPLVEATSSGGVAILETDNPNITVLWFFEQGT